MSSVKYPEHLSSAATFAGIQCQIHFGDFQEDKHKPGFIENLSEYLPNEYSNAWGVEKKIYREYKKHQGLSQLDAKVLYNKTARDLPTYGVTFFLVKEKQKGKKKLVPRLLGINAESILRLDEVTKEILQVWPLTHVKSYHAGKGETFTLNFGDYSEKEYSVKSRDALRIRDILQGYIDLIRKRMLARYHHEGDEGMVVCQDQVQAARGNVMEVVAHGAEKMVQQSFVGPSRLLPHEQGARAQHGTQLVTAQQAIINELAHKQGVAPKEHNAQHAVHASIVGPSCVVPPTSPAPPASPAARGPPAELVAALRPVIDELAQQRAVKSSISMRTDMSKNSVRGLNKLNASAVQVVSLLTTPTDASIKEAQKIIESMEKSMPDVVEGLKETIAMQESETRKKLQDELQELMDLVKKLASETKQGDVNPPEAVDTAMTIADLSMQMYFSLDPNNRRRSQQIEKSRASFKKSEKKEERQRRESFVAAATTALHSVEMAQGDMAHEYTGPPFDPKDIENLERSLVDKIGKLSATVALYLTAHADPNDIDYSASVTSMNTIKEIMPELVEDIQALGSSKSPADRKTLLDDIKGLCAATKRVCMLSGSEDHEQIQEASNDYADVSSKLIFTLGRGINVDKRNEIIEIAKQVGDKTSLVLLKANELSTGVMDIGEAAAGEVDDAGIRVAHAARDLLACAQLTAPAIHEPHCRSALTAAAESLSSSTQHLANTWKPLVEEPKRQQLGDQLQNRTTDLYKAIERLKDSFDDLDDYDLTMTEVDDGSGSSPQETERLKFLLKKSIGDVNDNIQAAEQELNEPIKTEMTDGSVAKAQSQLDSRLADLNAAVAALLAATADRDKVDFAAAAQAVDSISSLLPAVAKDAKGAGADEAGRRALLQHTRALCAASRALCAAAGDQQPEALHSAVGQFADATRKLRFVLPQTRDPAREQEIVSRAGAACGAASQVLGGVQQLGARLGGRAGAELDARGARLADAAQALLATAQVAGRDLLLAAAEALAREGQRLQAACRAQADPADPLLQRILADHTRLQAELDEFRAAVDADRARLASSVAAAENSLEAARQELDKPAAPLRGETVEQVQQRLSERLAALNAAIASLLAATADRDKVDFAAAAQAVDSISSLLPAVAKDAKGAGADEAGRRALLQHTRALCAASRALCAAAGDQQPEALHSAVGQFADATRKLRFVLPQTHDPAREQEIVSRAGAACGAASQVLGGVQQLGARLGGRAGAELDARGARLADAAQALLATAQVAGRDLLLAAAEALAREGQRLQAACRAQADPADPLLQRILADHTRLQAKLDEFRAAVDADRARLASSVAAAENSLEAASQELDKPAAPLRGETVEQVQQRLSERLAALNAAVASLLAATADRDKVDFAAAARAVDSISSLLPAVVKDAKGAGADEAGRRALLQHTRALCAASRALCAAAGDQQPEALHSAVGQFADATRKLRFVLPQTNDPAREQEVMTSAAAACGAATQLVSDAQKLEDQVGSTTGARPGGAEGDILTRGGRVSDATEALLAAAQLTAGNIELTSCRKALLKAAENLAVEGEGLLTACQTVTDHAHPLLQCVQSDNTRLQTEVDRLSGICVLPLDKKPPTLPKKVRPRVPKRLSSLEEPPRVAHATPGAEVGDPTRDFLQQLRSDEEQERTRAADKEKELHRQFVASVSDACKDIQAAKESLKAPGQASGQAPVSAGEVAARQRAVQEALALAGVQVAGLVSANYADKIDYEAASKSTKELPKLMKSIADDAKSLSSVISGDARKKFLDDMLGLCEASQTLCEAAEKNREKLKEAATVFGEKSAKLLREVSTDVDIALENEIISRAKAIGDSASRMATDASELASSAGGAGDATDGCAMDIRKTGAECVDAAGKLVYTAMLVSPSIHNTVCQDALVSSADGLSNKLKSFSQSCKKADSSQAATLEKLSGEADNLEELLESLKKDIKGELGKRRIEKLVIEDSPLRQITMKILEDAKKRAGSEGGAQGGAQAAYASRLGAALRALDLAAARCARAPHDMEKHGSLQNAIQNLQMVLLQTRPKGPDKHDSHIVDLTEEEPWTRTTQPSGASPRLLKNEFIKDVSSEADKLHEVASGADVPRGKQVLEGVKEHCNQMHSEALQFISPTADQPSVDADTLDGLVEIDHFGQNCGNHVADIAKLLDILPQDTCCSELRKQADILDDNCSFLRFATASAVSMARGVAGDEALADLQALQPRLSGLLPTAQATPDAAQSATATAGLARAVLAARRGQPAQLAPALAAYSTQLAPGSPAHRDRLLDHLNKLTGLLKALVACSNKRIATWQPGEGPELAAITEQILHELDNPVGTAENALQRQDSLVSPSLVNKLLSPNEHITTNADKRELEHKMEKLSAFLTWMCSGTLPEESNPANLPTKMRDMIDSTIKLGSIARAMKPRDDPVQSQRIEEAAQEMSYAAYALLKTGELVQQDLKHPDSRRKLLDACRSLSDAINRLNRSTPCKNKVKRECTEALGGLEARLALGPEARRRAPPASCLPYAACLDALDEHKDVIHKLQSEEKMSREEFMKSLNFISSAVCNSVDYAGHCNYLLSVSEQDKAVATEGLVDVPHVQKAAGAVHDLCVQVVRVDPDQAQEEVPTLEQRVQDLVQALDQAQSKVKDTKLQSKVIHAKDKVETTAHSLCEAIRNGSQDKIAPLGMELLSATREARAVISLPALVPQVGDVTADTRARCDEISNNCKELLNKTQALIKEVSNSSKDDDDEDEMLTWTSFSHKKNVVDAFDKLFKSVRANGQKAGIVEVDQSEIDEAGAQKSYVQSQVEIANKWLSRPNCKADVKAAGEEAVRNVVEVGRKMSVELKDNEKEDMVNLITDTEELFGECSKKYDQEKYSQLSERLKELRKAIEQGVVTWIVEDFLEGEPPLVDLDILVDSEKDMNKRELILERKIAELLAQLARVNKTANFVAHAGLAGPTHNKELAKCREETELLAPLLVKAAQERIASPDNQAIVEHYKDLLAKYTESLSKVQELCDQAVDPTEFVQTAGETMQRLREESTDQDDLQKCDYTSKAITGLAERVMCVSLSSSRARREPELQRALAAAQRRLEAARAPPARRSALPDWRHTTAEIMRTTGEVEAVLVGENIFEKQPEVDQPIFAAARGLHAAVRSWRARDNGVVAGARRLAVLMARLSGHMHEDKKHELIMTSKSIVMESHEVVMLARKLAHECTDLRIKNNLLQTCERIPTISGQLKMLTTVKGSSLGHQGSEEDKEAMDMLVGNAENLMMSIQEVVKAAASASVKIASQRGPKMRWVRKAYY